MCLYKKIFSYGLHDTYINKINLKNDKLEMEFYNGVYNLDINGTETTLTKSAKLIVTIDKRNKNIKNLIEIIQTVPTHKHLSIDRLIKMIEINTLDVNKVYYSSFNNTILLDCGIKDKVFYFFIEDCIDVDYLF